MGFLKRLLGGEQDQAEKAPAEEEAIEYEMFDEDELPGEAPVPPGHTPVLRIEIDRQSCTGMQDCMRIAPGVFELDEEGIAIVVDASAATREQLLEAARECPTQAIKLYELDGTQIYPDWM